MWCWILHEKNSFSQRKRRGPAWCYDVAGRLRRHDTKRGENAAVCADRESSKRTAISAKDSPAHGTRRKRLVLFQSMHRWDEKSPWNQHSTGFFVVEMRGIEPLTSWMPFKRSPKWATPPRDRIRKRYFRVPYYNIKPALECQENIAKKYYFLSFNLQNRFL